MDRERVTASPAAQDYHPPFHDASVVNLGVMSIPRRVVLASDDLSAKARILAVAEEAGIDVLTTPPTGFRAHLAGADMLILDLDRGRDEALAELKVAAEAGQLPDEVVGFLSHVDGSLARSARAAGCRAMARGRFWSSLPEVFGA